MVMVNSTWVKMNTLVTVPQTAQLKMIVSGILGVLGLLVQKLVEVDLLRDQELFLWRLNWMVSHVLKKITFKANNATKNPVPFANGVNGLTGQNANGEQGKDRELEVKPVFKMKEFKRKNVLQFIANGTNGATGAHVQRDAMESNRECELSWNLQPMEVLLVKEKQLRQDSALMDHVKVSR